VVHERGFAAASVRDIIQAAGVPQGSFTNHFASKEAFGLEVLDVYFAGSAKMLDETVRNKDLAPLVGLGKFLDANTAAICSKGLGAGCLIGNFSAEAGAQSELIRLRVVEIWAELENAVFDCLKAALKAGDLKKGTDCRAMAGFIIGSLQGSILQSKVERSAAPMKRLKKILMQSCLAQAA
jgi:TetR/AcrR family transcriptional repressor of nem operon